MSPSTGQTVTSTPQIESGVSASSRQPHDERLLNKLRVRSMRARFLLAFLLIVLFTAIPISIGAVGIAQRSGQNQILAQLESVAVVKQGIIDTWLDSLDAALASMSPPGDVSNAIEVILLAELDPAGADASLAVDDVRTYMHWAMAQTEVFDEVFLMDNEGRARYSTNPLEADKVHINQVYFNEGLKGPYVSAPFYSPSQKRLSIVATRPLVDELGNHYGVIGGRASMDKLSSIMLEQAGLGETGQTYLVGANHGLLTSAKDQIVTDDDIIYVRNGGVNQALDARQSVGDLVEDFRGEPVVGRYQWYPRLQVLLVAEQDQTEAFRPIYWMLGLIMAVSLLAILVALILSRFVTRRITTPVIALADAAVQVEEEHFDPVTLDLSVVTERDDELGQLARVFESMARTVYAREQRLKQQVQELQIVIDESKRKEQVTELTESEFFRDLTRKARQIRDKRQSPSPKSSDPDASAE